MENIFRSDLFAGKTVLVTGGGSGIGLAIARNFGTLGARVVIAARDQERLIEAGQSLREAGVDAIELEVNIRDSDSVAGLIE